MKRGFGLLSLFEDKRGATDTGEEGPAYSTIIFIILNLIFFSILLAFIWRAASGALIYEQTYAKEIALMLDKAKPGTEIVIHFKKGFETAKKNKVLVENSVVIDGEMGEVVVRLASNGGYRMKYFSDLAVEKRFDVENKKLILEIKKIEVVENVE